MSKFAFVIHPITARDAARKYPIARYVPESLLKAFLRVKRPLVASEVRGIESRTGARAEGIFVACPLTPHMMLHEMPLERVYDRIVQCCELAAREGAELVGLGAFTSVVGDGGITIAKRSPIPVTTGNSYTVGTAIQGLLKACGLVGVDSSSATLAVVGATGSIGKTCARWLAPQFSRTILVGRDLARTQALAEELPHASASTDFAVLREAEAIVTVTSSDTEVIEPEHLRPGAVICDVARPRDVSVRVARERSDVLVIEGGVVSVPGNVEFGINFGFPPKTAYACMSETMILALENRPESFTLGKDVSVEQVREMIALADKHGFELAGFRSFEKEVDEGAIRRARDARQKVVLA